ncbi:MAG: hypothetical protein DSM106950_36120 [Stigonema ocellatum SAG 48.90 = DSM 106950]|nr:hypothetical protein [Stigonema ocellatum SAG 48.90 = DSM 106950]
MSAIAMPIGEGESVFSRMARKLHVGIVKFDDDCDPTTLNQWSWGLISVLAIRRLRA